ncbi:MAG: heparinase II/III family protein [Lachnospiraceae bacterium]|jgi:hypothetical protein
MEHLPVWTDVVNESVSVSQCYQDAAIRYRSIQDRTRRVSDYILKNQPDLASDVIKQADQFMQGMMVLCGTMGRPFFVGCPPKWTENPVGDNEYVFMLNRMEHWPVLLHAYYLTGKTAYAEKVVSELENWIDTCEPLEISTDYSIAKPRFDAPTPWRPLELGFRANRSWNIVLQLLAGRDVFPESVYQKMMLSFYEQAQILYKVSPVLWPRADHNHYLTECLGLLEISCICSFMKDAGLWQKQALRELERCAKNQIVSTGAQIEGAPEYHNECLLQLDYSIELAEQYHFAFSRGYHSLVHSMLERSIYTTRPDGSQVPWGDSDAHPLVFRSAFCHYRAFHETDALSDTAAIFGKEGLLKEFDRQIWFLNDVPGARKIIEDTHPCKVSLPVFKYDADMKQVMMRTSWSASADSVFFSARSPVHNDHAHIDPNAFEYYSHGYAVMPDPGRYSYREGGDRHYYKSTEAHNTLTVNGRDAFPYLGTWAYGPQKQGGILSAGHTDQFSYACGFHDNFAPARHIRLILLSEAFLLVFDIVKGLRRDDIVSDYFLFDTLNAQLKPGLFRAESPDGQLVTHLSYTGNDTAAILAGRLSEVVDSERNARRLCLSAGGKSEQLILSIVCCRDKPDAAYAENLRIVPKDNQYVLDFSLSGQTYEVTLDSSSWAADLSRISG